MNKTLAKKLIDDKTRDYMNARRVSKVNSNSVVCTLELVIDIYYLIINVFSMDSVSNFGKETQHVRSFILLPLPLP